MKIKSNVRAGSGGASGAGKNSKLTPESVDVVVPVYVAPVVARCAGI